MAASVVNHIRKDPNIQLVLFDTASVESMEDVRDWVFANLPEGYTINLMTSMGGLLSWSNNGNTWTQVRPGQYVAKDSNGKLFILTQELVDAFYDPAP